MTSLSFVIDGTTWGYLQPLQTHLTFHFQMTLNCNTLENKIHCLYVTGTWQWPQQRRTAPRREWCSSETVCPGCQWLPLLANTHQVRGTLTCLCVWMCVCVLRFGMCKIGYDIFMLGHHCGNNLMWQMNVYVCMYICVCLYIYSFCYVLWTCISLCTYQFVNAV